MRSHAQLYKKLTCCQTVRRMRAQKCSCEGCLMVTWLYYHNEGCIIILVLFRYHCHFKVYLWSLVNYKPCGLSPPPSLQTWGKCPSGNSVKSRLPKAWRRSWTSRRPSNRIRYELSQCYHCYGFLYLWLSFTKFGDNYSWPHHQQLQIFRDYFAVLQSTL